jgi:hypothetical protein
MVVKHPVIMGILNLTPDSFIDGGTYKTSDDALERAKEMIAEGAEIVDIGGGRPSWVAFTLTPKPSGHAWGAFWKKY